MTANPIIRTTQVLQAPEWDVREYTDGSFDAAHRTGPALSPVLGSFAQAVRWAKDEAAGRDPLTRLT